MNSRFKLVLLLCFSTFVWACSNKYITKTQIFKGNNTVKEKIAVGLLITDLSLQTRKVITVRFSDRDGVVRLEEKDLKKNIKKHLGKSKLGKIELNKIISSAPLSVVYEKSGSLFFEGLDTMILTSLYRVKEKNDEEKIPFISFTLKEKKIKGKVYIHESLFNGDGRIIISIDKEDALVDSFGIFKIRFNNKEKAEWGAKISLSDMVDYLDTTYSINFSKQDLENLEFRFEPIPKLMPIIQDDIVQIDSKLSDMEEEIRELEKKRDRLPGQKRHAAYVPINKKIIYLKNKINLLRNRFDELKIFFKPISDKISAGNGDPKDLLDLKDIRSMSFYLLGQTEDDYKDAQFWSQYYPKDLAPAKITGQLFWNSGDYRYTDLPSGGKEKLGQIINDIKNLRNHPFNRSYKNNTDFCIYLNIDCSADRQPFTSNELDFHNAKRNLISNYGVEIIDEVNSTNDIDNYRLSLLRGHTLLIKIIEDFKEKGYKTIIKFHVFGCSKANGNSNNSPDDRFALITYWIETTR